MREFLYGGREDIYREDKIVFRPQEEWTKSVHSFLSYLHNKGFDKVPYPYGITEDRKEKVSFLEGDIYNSLSTYEVQSDETLISFCNLIKEFHNIGEEYIKQLTGSEKWMLPTCTPVETMCHGDLAPYNTVMIDNKAVGIIDFDTLHPGSKMWDIGYSLYRWVPLMSPDNPENFGNEKDKVRRFNLFLSTYGIEDSYSDETVNWVIRRLNYLISFMEKEARGGNTVFQQNIEDGHLKQYYRDVQYIKLQWGQQ